MATRTISTKLAIEGESEYRAALSRINTELKTAQSSLKLVESEFKNNANTLEALKSKHEAIERVFDTQKKKVDELAKALENAKSAQETYAQKSEELRAKIKSNEEALEKLRASTKNTTEEEQKLIKENEELNRALTENGKYLAAAEKGTNSWQTQLNNAKAYLNDLDAELKQNDALLDEATKSADGCAHSIDEFGNEVNESKGAVEALAQALAAAGLAKTAQEIAEALQACVDSSIAFESSMAGVKRTVGGNDSFIEALGDSFKQMSTQMPITTTELARIAETAGQLGIKQEAVEQFTEVMAKLATTTDLSADSAATMLAQFSNITGSSDFERLGSVVAALGDSTATTASKVVEMSQGMAAAASVAGMSETDILAISAAVGSLGIESQAGSTAMSTLISTLYKATETGDKLEDFASVAGMTGSEFKKAWQDDAAGALNAFITGLNDTERNGRSAIVVLDDLGITNVRQTKAILGLSESEGLLTRTISLANKAWQENSSLNEKAGIMYETTESKITLYKNSVDNLKVAVGDQLTPALGNLAEKGTSINSWAADMVKENEWLAPAITAVATSMGSFLVTLTATTTIVPLVKDAFMALHAALLANPYALVAAAIAAVVSALAALSLTLPETESEYRSLTATSKDQYDKLQRLNTEYQKACDLYGENSEEARKLAAQIDSETEIFNHNRSTIEGVIQKTNDLISSNQQLREESAAATDSINKSYESSTYLINRLQDLQGEEEKSAGTKQQILAVVDALNQQIPELGLAYDQYNDELSMTTDNLMELAKAEAQRQKAAADFQEQVALEGRQAEIDAQLITIRTNLAAATERLNTAVAERDAALANYDDNALLTMAYNSTDAVNGYVDAVVAAQQEVDGYIEAEKNLSAEYEKNAEEIRKLADAHNDLSTETVESVRAEEVAVEAISGKLDKLAQSYADAYTTAHNSISGMFDLWEQAPVVAANNIDEMIQAQQTQAEWLSIYGTLFDELMNRNIEGIELLGQTVADVSPQSAAALMAFSNASDEELQQLITTIQQTKGEEDALSAKVATVQVDVNGKLSELKQDYANAVVEIAGTGADVDFSAFTDAVAAAFEKVGAKFETAGSDAGTGLKNGITMSSGLVYTAANGMAQGIVDAVLMVLDEHSPSKVLEKAGENAGEGLAQGIEAKSERVTNAAEKLARDISELMNATGRDSVDSFLSSFNAIEAGIQESIESARAAVEELAPDINSSMENVGSQMIAGMINGLYNESGSLYAAVSEIVYQAIETARREAGVHSPSWKTEKIFEHVGEGMVVGVEKKKKDVSEATKDVVKEALTIDTASLEAAAQFLTMRPPDMSSMLLPSLPSAPVQGYGDVNISIDMSNSVIREEADIRKISESLAQEIRVALRQKGSM